MASETPTRALSAEQKKVVFASSLGTAFEWYDFYLYGSLATIIGRQFFSGLDDGSAFVFALLAFAAGFVVRPFGALVFGRLGDIIGRKYTFLVTIVIMGLSTFIVGVVPNYASIGVAAPLILIFLRLLQGLALGGEYGGAATYVAEHAPFGRRGAYTAWIQTTATVGLLLSLLVIMGTRAVLGEGEFEDWGWRVPFLLSIVLLGVSVYIRLSLSESPVFTRMKAQGRRSSKPLTEAFARWKNLRLVLIGLLGLTAGQAVIWYGGQFYTLLFLTQTLKVDNGAATVVVALSLLVGTPFFIGFGALSDRIGRKPLILAGFVLAALTYFPVFSALTKAANPALAAAQAASRVTLTADPLECSFQLSLTGAAKFSSSCDRAKQALAQAGVSYDTIDAPAGTVASVTVGDTVVPSFQLSSLVGVRARERAQVFEVALAQALEDAAFPTHADMTRFETWTVVALLSYLVVLVALVYAPMAALLVEMFPTRIRYTSVSLPYHLGNGWFGGLLPTISFAIVAQTGQMYSGLWYPVLVAACSAVVCALYVRETKDVDLEEIE